MTAPYLPFRLDAAALEGQLRAFNARTEIGWFGFDASFEAPGTAWVVPSRVPAGALGGGGTAALNGGVISAGFDAAFVLAGLGHFDTPVVVTLELSVRFLSLALAQHGPRFRAGVVRSSRHFAFVEGELLAHDGSAVFASASGLVAPR